MPDSLLLVAFLLVISFSLNTLAVLLYCQNRHSLDLRWGAMLLFSLGAASLALASLLWMESRFAAKTLVQAPVSTYSEVKIPPPTPSMIKNLKQYRNRPDNLSPEGA